MSLLMRPVLFILCITALALTVFYKTKNDGGVHTIDTGQAYEEFLARLKTSIEANGLTIAEGACGKCAIKTLKDIDEDALIITVYRADIMMRMLQAGAAAGSEPPLRFYVSKLEDGNARLTYHQPSDALAIYEAPALAPLGKELNLVFTNIVDAVR